MPAAADQVRIDLGAYFNNNVFSEGKNSGRDGINIWRNTLPSGDLPSCAILEVAGIQFIRPSAEDGACNDVICDGQFVSVSPGTYDWIYVIAAGERRTEDVVYLHFADGAVDPEWIRVSDFFPGYSHFGEPAAIRFSALHYRHHTQHNSRPAIWLQRIPVTRMQQLSGFRLPVNRSLHLFAVTLVTAANLDPHASDGAVPVCGPGHTPPR